MSILDQYSVADILSQQSNEASLYPSTDAGDPYSDVVTVFGNHNVGSFTLTDFVGVHFTPVNIGYSLSPVSAVSPGAKDFCIEIVARIPGTYPSEVFNQLKLIDIPIFYTGAFSGSGVSQLVVYIENNNKPVAIGLNGMRFLCIDDDEVYAALACPAEAFNTWISSSQYKSITVGRRGQTFFMYLNGVLVAETTVASFGSITVPALDSCHLMTVPEHKCLTNFLSGFRMTTGASRASGPQHIHKASADAILYPSSAIPITGKTLLSDLTHISRPVYATRKRCDQSDLFDTGFLFNFSGVGNVLTRTIEGLVTEVRSVVGNKKLSPLGNGYFNKFDGEFRSTGGGIRTLGNFTNFIFCLAFSVDAESVTNQDLLQLTTFGPYPTARKRLVIRYSNGQILFVIQVLNDYGEVTSTPITLSSDVQSGAKSFCVGRSASGFFFIVDGVTKSTSYSLFDAVNEVLVASSCASCVINEFYYRESGVTQAVLESYAAFFSERNGDEVEVAASNDVAECSNEAVISGNVLSNDTGRFLFVSKVNGLSASVGVAVAGNNGGTFTIGSDGSWTFDPNGDFESLTGSETAETSVTYYASDGAAEARATLTITVSAVTGATLWTPAEISGAIVFDSLDSDNITLSGSAVTAWADMLGSGLTASQATAAAQPQLVDGAIVFDGGDYLTIPSSTATFNEFHSSGGTVVGLVMGSSVDDLNATSTIFGNSGSGASIKIGIALTYDDLHAYSRYDALIVRVSRGSSPYAVNQINNDKLPCLQYTIFDAVVDPDASVAADRCAVSYNGETDIKANTNTATRSTANASYNMQIGSGGANTYTLKGKIKVLAFVPSIISNEDRARLVGWAAHRHGMTSLLPSDHPYKSAPPTI